MSYNNKFTSSFLIYKPFTSYSCLIAISRTSSTLLSAVCVWWGPKDLAQLMGPPTDCIGTTWLGGVTSRPPRLTSLQ